MSKQLVSINLDSFDPLKEGHVDYALIDATTEEDIARHILEDIQESKRVAGEEIQEIRQQMGMTQEAFSDALHISVKTLRNWEQGIRLPTGPARTLLKILRARPEMALDVLSTCDPQWSGLVPRPLEPSHDSIGGPTRT